MGLFDIFKKKKPELTQEQLKWNKMWDLWVENKAASPYAELMTYQSEVNNGGHDQYFSNVENNGDVEKEMSALEQVLSQKMSANLKKAYKAYLEEDDEKSEEILEKCDDLFYENDEEINRVLEEYASKITL